jgi:cytochrome c oxidase subunit II
MGSEERTEPARPASETLRVAERSAPIGPLIGIAVIASALGIALGLIIDWFPVQASTQADKIDTFYDVLIIASVPVFVLVTSVVLYSVYRFRMRPGEENMDGPPIHGNTRLEVIWTIIPAVLMLGLCTYAYVELHDAEKAPAATGGAQELNVRVVGEQFAWTFFYKGSNGKEFSSPQLYVPKDRSVRFTVQTKDVLHDFWVPAFRWKIDAVPGINTHYRVTPNRLGNYAIVCAELCGLGHATMRQTAHVLTQQAFTAWQQKAQNSGQQNGGGGGGSGSSTTSGGGGGGGGADGKAIFASAGCAGCHTLADAGSNGQTGPNLDDGLKGKDEAFIKQSIENPNAVITKGYQPGIMPGNYKDQLSPAEIDALAKYLEETTNG